jgi:predicted nucleic acid-binding protein
MPDPVYFDSSVFLAIFMGEASGQSIKELLKELRRDKIRIYTSIVTIQEVSVQTFRKRAIAADNYTKVNKLARIHGITKEIAITAAKLEAQILDDTKPKDREENKQRKWDCFHLAAAMELGCRTFYSLDDKQLARGRRFCAGVWFGKPAPKNLSLPLFPEPEIEGRTDGKELSASETKATPDAKEKPDDAATTEGNKLQADPAHPAPVQGSDSGRAQGEAAQKAEPKAQT